MVQKWPEINGRQFSQSVSREREGRRISENMKRRGRAAQGRGGHRKSCGRCDFDSMCTIRRHLTPRRRRRVAPSGSSNVTASKTSVGQMMRRAVSCRRPKGKSIDLMFFVDHLSFGRPTRNGTIFWRFLCCCLEFCLLLSLSIAFPRPPSPSLISMIVQNGVEPSAEECLPPSLLAFLFLPVCYSIAKRDPKFASQPPPPPRGRSPRRRRRRQLLE